MCFSLLGQLTLRTSSATSTRWQACCGVVMEGL
ncbi:hypothetical protein T07_13084 [Trichinella nelsoni]|uniref:Uncharacterized protein n=1 Tax=Trichinella nelsoni TaxID=6336 RepID=A0A0V0RA29_9BILA|nr:hypothetical protein T07_13084 [Trichinella nelsoni]